MNRIQKKKNIREKKKKFAGENETFPENKNMENYMSSHFSTLNTNIRGC